MREQVSQWLCEWFASRKKIEGGIAQPPNVNYFEAGLLSSLEVIEFVSEIEDHFGVHFSEQDFHDARFVTIAGLSELIAEHTAQTSERI